MKRIFNKTKNALRQVRHKRVRAIVKGTAVRPRISVFRGLRSTNIQLVDDVAGVSLASVNSASIKEQKAGELSGKIAKAYLAGKKIAEMALEKNIKEAVFDRAGYKYHGRVKAVADGARDQGLKL
ncbi:MAG: 50S ribosomal protein L18 [bacterium]